MNCPNSFHKSLLLHKAAKLRVKGARPCPPQRTTLSLAIRQIWSLLPPPGCVLVCESIIASNVKYVYATERHPPFLPNRYCTPFFGKPNMPSSHSDMFFKGLHQTNGNTVHCWEYFQCAIICKPQILTTCTLFCSHPLYFIN